MQPLHFDVKLLGPYMCVQVEFRYSSFRALRASMLVGGFLVMVRVWKYTDRSGTSGSKASRATPKEEALRASPHLSASDGRAFDDINHHVARKPTLRFYASPIPYLSLHTEQDFTRVTSAAESLSDSINV